MDKRRMKTGKLIGACHVDDKVTTVVVSNCDSIRSIILVDLGGGGGGGGEGGLI